MDDPCEKCEKAEQRLLHLKRQYAPLAGTEDQDKHCPLNTIKAGQHAVQRYEHLFEIAPDAIFIADAESGIILDANQSAVNLLGIPVEQIIGMHQSQLHPPDEAERYKEVFREHSKQESGVFFSENMHVWHKDGKKIPVQINSAVTHNDGKKIIYGIFRDVRKLKVSQERYKRLAEATFDGIVFHENGVYIESNQQFADMFGYSADEIVGLDGYKLFTPESAEVARKKIATGDKNAYRATCVRKNGTTFPAEIRARAIPFGDKIVRVAMVRDLSNESNLRNELQESEAKYYTLINEIMDPTAVVDREGHYVYMNKAGLKQVGLTLDELAGKHASEIVRQEVFDLYWPTLQQVFQTGQSQTINQQLPVQGEPRWFMHSFHPLRSASGSIDLVLGISRNIHDIKALQEKLSENERRFRQLYQNARIALFRTSLDGTLLDCNKACVRFFGYTGNEPEDEYLNRFNVTDSYADPDHRKSFIEALKKDGRVDRFEVELYCKDGTTLWASISAELFADEGYIEGSIYNITAKKMLTPSEKLVLTLLLEGKSNKQIAKKLGRSIRTIEDHRGHIMHKFGVDNAFELTQKAEQMGFKTTAK